LKSGDLELAETGNRDQPNSKLGEARAGSINYSRNRKVPWVFTFRYKQQSDKRNPSTRIFGKSLKTVK